MDNKTNQQIQIRTSSEKLPAVSDAKSLADIRLDQTSFPRYRNIPQRKRLEWLASEAKMLASVLRLREFDVKDAILIATMLDEMVSKDNYMADLTLPEFHESFMTGVFGNFGPFYGLNAPALFGFIQSFLVSDTKREAARIVRERLKLDEERKREEERRIEQQKIRAEIEQAKRDGTFVPTGKAWFQPKKVDEVIDSAEHREKIHQQAEEIFRKEWYGTD